MSIEAMKRVVEAFDALPPDHPARYANLQINLLRTAIQQATQPAEVTGLLEAFDDAVSQELLRVSHVEYDSHEICKHFASKVRAILALRPVQVPMTDEEIGYWYSRTPSNFVFSHFKAGIRSAEAHHFGITAQSKKEGV